ncbi:flagellar hook-associated protein FlgK [Pseudomonas putida]|uniref:flagellar hook-associated protein FlgK n=1 Tax=Pseudomonas putida TaxID=303 RepID=UPI00105A6C88|nr:flagellar hook-associated protein FlgK [Pseudomonas putida]TDJ76653.1 flagellar hook-associated protein FlgK [Pseudomonas putida]
MSNLISIGLSGLSATQSALATTSNNITNVATSGYSRQQTTQAAGALQSIGGAGYVGSGTTVSEVRRIYSAYLQSQVGSSTALNSEATTYSTQISSLDSLLSDSSTGITAVLASFYTALQTAASTPNDTAARQLFLTSASTLSNRFNTIASQMNQQNESINSQLTTLSGQVNSLTSSIASLNQQIVALSANGSSPNSLLDARDEAVRQLNELVGVTVQQRDGNYDVYLGTGQPLVTGNTANKLTAQGSANDPGQYSLTLQFQSFSTDVTSVATGGEIGGLLRYRKDVLNPAMNELGRLAIVVSDTINSQLGQGLDLNGDFGSQLFASVNSASAMSQRSLASANNSAGSGNLDVAISDSSALTTYNYQVKFTSGTAYTVTRSDGTSMGSFDLTDDPAPEIDGFTLSLNGGALSAGDSFNVIPTRTGASNIGTVMTDANKLAFSGALSGTAATSNTGTGAITQPTLNTELDIYGGTDLSQMQSAIENGMPVKLVFGAASNGTQTYTVYNAQGTSIGTGSIVPGQDNALSIDVPMLDDSGNPILDGNGVAMSYSFGLTFSGAPSSGDSFTVAFNSDGSNDNRNAQSVLALQTANTVGVNGNNTGMSMGSSYATLVEGVGAMASQASLDATATTTVLKSATDSRDSLAGVSLDEEAADLVKFQQYYTASSQIIKAAQETFSTLINSL